VVRWQSPAHPGLQSPAHVGFFVAGRGAEGAGAGGQGGRGGGTEEVGWRRFSIWPGGG